MKKNIIFLLKFRRFLLKKIINSNNYEFISPKLNNKNIYLSDPNYFDNESILIFKYLIKQSEYNKMYNLKSINKFNFNILFKRYKTANELQQIINLNYLQNNEKFINKQLMSHILFTYKYSDDNYFIFVYSQHDNLVKFDTESEIQKDLVDYYFNNEIKNINNKIWFTSDVIKYIKISTGFKITKFYPYLINI